MKKILIVLLLITLNFQSKAHVDHYKNYKKIEMEILRNGKVIGYNNYFFTKNGDETVVTNQIKFSIEVMGATIFSVDGYGEEKYLKDQLVSFESKTLQNKKEKFVNLILNPKTNKFFIKGSSYTGEAKINNIIGNWWNHRILQVNSQISPISGSIKEQIVTFVGKDKIEQYGKTFDVDHFTLRSKDMSLPKDKRLDFNIWYEKESAQIIRVSYNKMGNWEYRLKNFD